MLNTTVSRGDTTMNKRNIIIVSILIIAFFGFKSLFTTSNNADVFERNQYAQDDLNEEPEVNEFTPFVKPKVKEIQLKRKKNMQSKVAQFRQKVAQNSPTLVQTRAHEFHNPNGGTLNGAGEGGPRENVAKKVPETTEKKEPQTEEEIKKAEEQAKEQAKIQNMMKEHCGDITDAEEKAECHQAVANYYAYQKEQEKQRKAKEKRDAESGTTEVAENDETSDGNEPTNDDSESDNNETTPPTTTGIVNPPQDNNETGNDNDTKNKSITLAEWKQYLETDIKAANFIQAQCGEASSTDGENTNTSDNNEETVIANDDNSVENLLTKAASLHFATNKSGCQQLKENDFIILMREYYIESNEAELEAAGIRNLYRRASRARYELAFELFNKAETGSTEAQKQELKNNTIQSYLRDDRLTAINVFISQLPIPSKSETVIDDGAADFASTANEWNNNNPLYVAFQIITTYADTRGNEIDAEDKASVNQAQAVVGQLTSIQQSLNAIADPENDKNDVTTLASVKTDAANAANSVGLLLNKIQALSPTTETTNNVNFGFVQK